MIFRRAAAVVAMLVSSAGLTGVPAAAGTPPPLEFCFAGGVFSGDLVDDGTGRPNNVIVQFPAKMRLFMREPMTKRPVPECAAAQLTITWKLSWGTTVTGPDRTVTVAANSRITYYKWPYCLSPCIYYTLQVDDGLGHSGEYSDTWGFTGYKFVSETAGTTPDNDGDRVPNYADSCPSTAGPASNLGCPTTNGGRACVFNAPSGAMWFGHSGWAFRVGGTNKWMYGSTENNHGNPSIPQGGDSDSWSKVGTWTQVVADFKGELTIGGETYHRVRPLRRQLHHEGGLHPHRVRRLAAQQSRHDPA